MTVQSFAHKIALKNWSQEKIWYSTQDLLQDHTGLASPGLRAVATKPMSCQPRNNPVTKPSTQPAHLSDLKTFQKSLEQGGKTERFKTRVSQQEHHSGCLQASSSCSSSRHLQGFEYLRQESSRQHASQGLKKVAKTTQVLRAHRCTVHPSYLP